MSQRLPLFPLGTVLYPGLLLPLHIFEERYRQLVRDLLAEPEPRQFGVIAIKKGRETGIDGISTLYEVGCTATLRRVVEHPDGRYDLVTLGTDRFRLTGLDESQPYLQADVEMLPEDTGDDAAAAVAMEAVQRGFGDYRQALAKRSRYRQRRRDARRPRATVLPGGRLHGGGPAGPADATGPAGRAAAPGGGTRHAHQGDRHAAHVHLGARPWPAERPLEPELTSARGPTPALRFAESEIC
jgi:Lon protease-like protein